jgi:hypothetical protein
MKSLIFIVLILIASCQKEAVVPPQPQVVVPPKPIVCDKFHYGDSCKLMYIDNYLGEWLLINSNIFKQRGPSSVTKYNFDTCTVRVEKRWDGYYMTNIWGNGEEMQVYSTDIKDGFYGNLLPMYKDFPIGLKNIVFQRITKDTLKYKGYSETTSSGFTFTSDVTMKLVRK